MEEEYEKIISLLICLTIILSSGITVFANETESYDVSADEILYEQS